MPQRRVGKGAAGIVDHHPILFGLHLGDRVGDAFMACALAGVEYGCCGQAVVGRHAGICFQNGRDAVRRGCQQNMPDMCGRRPSKVAATQQHDKTN